jgi:hypothetical protein
MLGPHLDLVDELENRYDVEILKLSEEQRALCDRLAARLELSRERMKLRKELRTELGIDEIDG